MRTCPQEENYNSQVESRLIATAIVFAASVVRDERMWRRARMWKYDALQISETCLSKDIWESRKTPRLFIDDWSLMGDPATVMVWTDLAKAASGFDMGLEKAMASDLDGLRWRPLFKSQSWTLWVHTSIEAIWVASVEELAPMYSWVSSAYWWKDTIPLLFWMSELSPITSATGEMNKTKRRGPRTEPCGTPVSEESQGEDDESILTKDERFVKYEWIQVWTVPDKPNVCSSLWRRLLKCLFWIILSNLLFASIRGSRYVIQVLHTCTIFHT